MKTILVTGGLGYIGSHICVELVNYNVIVLDNLCNSNKEIIQDINRITNKPITFYNVSINDSEALDDVFNKNSIDVVIHLAALKSVNDSVNNPLAYYYNNVTGTLNLLSIMKKYGVKNFIFSSSATVYKTSNDMLHEDCELGPINPYGNTKWMIETILKDLTDFNCTILRYFNPIGNNQNGLLYNHCGSNIMPSIGNAIKNNTALPIFGGDYDTIDGTCIRDYVHVIDLAKAHVAVMNQQGYHVYNIGTGVGTSVLQLVQKMGVKYYITERREGDVQTYVCDPSKIYKELGWKTELTIDDMCKDTLHGINKNINSLRGINTSN